MPEKTWSPLLKNCPGSQSSIRDFLTQNAEPSFADVWSNVYRPVLKEKAGQSDYIRFIRDWGVSRLHDIALAELASKDVAVELVSVLSVCFRSGEPSKDAQKSFLKIAPVIMDSISQSEKVTVCQLLFQLGALSSFGELRNAAREVLLSEQIVSQEAFGEFANDCAREAISTNSASAIELTAYILSKLPPTQIDAVTFELLNRLFSSRLSYVDTYAVWALQGHGPYMHAFLADHVHELPAGLVKLATSNFDTFRQLFTAYDSAFYFRDIATEILQRHSDSITADWISAAVEVFNTEEPGDSYRVYSEIHDRKQSVSATVSKFNQKPSDGVAFGLKEGSFTAEQLPSFLFKFPGLSKPAIGAYLAESPQTLSGFLAQNFDFTAKSFLHALREFLNRLRIPGEAQKIDRVLEAFARHFHACNSSDAVLQSMDVVHSLSYACLMLNTDIHNAKVKKKMELPEFIKSVKSVCRDETLSEEYLKAIYYSISQHKIELASDVITWTEALQGGDPFFEISAAGFSAKALFSTSFRPLAKHLLLSSSENRRSVSKFTSNAEEPKADALSGLVLSGLMTQADLEYFLDELCSLNLQHPAMFAAGFDEMPQRLEHLFNARLWERYIEAAKRHRYQIKVSSLSTYSQLCIMRALSFSISNAELKIFEGISSGSLERLLSVSYDNADEGLFAVLTRFCTTDRDANVSVVMTIVQRLAQEQMPYILENYLVASECILCLLDLAVSGDYSVFQHVIDTFHLMCNLLFSRVASFIDNEGFLICQRIFMGFNRLISVRENKKEGTLAMETLFEVIETYFTKFSGQQMHVIFERCVYPFIDSLMGQPISKSDSILTSSVTRISRILVSNTAFLDRSFVAPLLEVLRNLLGSNSESLARACADAIFILLPCFNSPEMLQIVEEVCDKTCPNFDQIDVDQTVQQYAHKLSIHLAMLQVLNRLLVLSDDSVFDHFVSCATPTGLARLFACLHRSYLYAKTFNENRVLRDSLLKSGFMSDINDIVLIKQESCAVMTLLSGQLRLYMKSAEQFDKDTSHRELLDLCEDILDRYIEYMKDASGFFAQIRSWSLVIQAILADLDRMLAFRMREFRTRLPRFCRKALAIIPSEDLNVRHAALTFVSDMADMLFEECTK